MKQRRQSKREILEGWGVLNVSSEKDTTILGIAKLCRAFRRSEFFPLFLYVTSKSRETILSNKAVMESNRPDFVLGMLHENQCIENSIDKYIEVAKEIEKKWKRENEVTAVRDENLGLAELESRFGAHEAD